MRAQRGDSNRRRRGEENRFGRSEYGGDYPADKRRQRSSASQREWTKRIVMLQPTGSGLIPTLMVLLTLVMLMRVVLMRLICNGLTSNDGPLARTKHQLRRTPIERQHKASRQHAAHYKKRQQQQKD